MKNNSKNEYDLESYNEELNFVKNLNLSAEDSHNMAILLLEMKRMLDDETLWQFANDFFNLDLKNHQIHKIEIL